MNTDCNIFSSFQDTHMRELLVMSAAPAPLFAFNLRWGQMRAAEACGQEVKPAHCKYCKVCQGIGLYSLLLHDLLSIVQQLNRWSAPHRKDGRVCQAAG